MKKMAVSEQENLMKRLQIQSFILSDVGLYLDTHPKDQKALKYYEQNRILRNQTLAAYTQRFGPISSNNVDVENSWTWVESPWPWEGEV